MTTLIPLFTSYIDSRDVEKLISQLGGRSEPTIFGKPSQIWGPNLSLDSNKRALFYFHGELEDSLEYDVPTFLEGNIEYSLFQEVRVFNPNTNGFLIAKLILFDRLIFNEEILYGLIVFHSDIPSIMSKTHMINNHLTPIKEIDNMPKN